MTSSFVNRLLRASLTLPNGTFPGTTGNTLVLANFRMSAKLAGSGNFTNSLNLQIWGMRQVDMNAVTVLFGQDGNPQTISTRAVVVLEASSDGGKSWLQVFEGQFNDAQPDYRNLPDVALTINAMAGMGQQWVTSPPTSINGSAPVAQIAQQLATAMGFPFEDNGVTGSLATPYFAGTLMDQFRQLAEAAPFDFYFDAKQTLIICPVNQPRLNGNRVVLNAASGLIGYPTLGRGGIEFDALFQPAFELGSAVELQNTQVPGCDGVWFPYALASDLDCIKPGGRWHSHLSCMRYPAAAIAGQA